MKKPIKKRSNKCATWSSGPSSNPAGFYRFKMAPKQRFRAGSFRTISLDPGSGIKAVIGRPVGETATKIQSVLIPTDRFDMRKARAWVTAHEAALKRKNPAAKLFTAFHWGKRPTGTVRGKIRLNPEMAELGTVREIVYGADKNDGPHEYTHKFGKPYPLLVSTPDGKQLHFVGGGYTVRPEGIVG